MSQLPQSLNPLSKCLEGYTLLQTLGTNREGGRITYLATHPAYKTPVVLKQFRFAQSEASWSGFKSHEREIEALQAVDHPRVPRYIDSFETNNGFCLVQEYKNAPSLAERTQFTPAQVQQIALAMLRVLVDLQQQSPPIIHRDIKPENVLVDDTLGVYLIDFGLAKLNHGRLAMSSVIAGTPGFMPPESFFNRPLSTAADLYSVGATIVGLLTQTASTDIGELLDDGYRFELTDRLPEVNPYFVAWLEKMVAPNPLKRFPDAATALQTLRAIDITDLSAWTALIKRRVKKRLFVSIVAGLSLSGLSIAVAILHSVISTSNSLTDFVQPAAHQPVASARSPERYWFEMIKPQCNSLEVITAVQRNPYPETPVGVGAGASCYALAGKLTLADEAISALPTHQQELAAMILFEVGHPVADRGDDESAGPIMDLVLKYWPENYMARYHAGMSAYVLADNEKAVDHLTLFLDTYTADDGWRQKALLAIDNIQKNIPADERFKVHH